MTKFRREIAIVAATGIALALMPHQASSEGFRQEGLPDNPSQFSYGSPEHLADLENRDIHESSGVAVSRRHPGVIWTHNDSGDQPRIFAFDLHGRHWAELLVRGAEAIDWEDVASFVHQGNSYLLLGDVGDNPKRRSKYTLYLVKEPDGAVASAKVLRAIHYKYEDGSHNCEAVAVDPTSSTVLLVSKVAGLVCSVYELDLSDELREAAEGNRGNRPEGLYTARRIARLPLPLVTAMDISPDGRRAILLTYAHAYEFPRQPGQPWKSALVGGGREIKMPTRRQGESICYGADGKTLYLTSEKTPTPLWRVPAAQKE